MPGVTIPIPCHEDWQKMTPTNKGAFCKSCAKEVVDFSIMTDDAVKNYLLERTSEKLCGRFSKRQLQKIEIYVPITILHKRMASWKKFMAILLFAFGSMLFGCNVIVNKTIKGELEASSCTTKEGTLENTTTGIILPEVYLNDTTVKNIIETRVAIDTACLVSTETQDKSISEPDTLTTGKLVSQENVITDTVQNLIGSTKAVKKIPADTSDCGNEKFY